MKMLANQNRQLFCILDHGRNAGCSRPVIVEMTQLEGQELHVSGTSGSLYDAKVVMDDVIISWADRSLV